MFFDSHAHYDDPKFDADRESLLASLAAEDISNLINVGSDLATSKQSVHLAAQYDFIHAAVGIHPSEVANLTHADLDALAALCAHKKVVAIGEIGLDYHGKVPEREIQIAWFEKQMALAYRLQKPVIIHTRDAMEDTLTVLKRQPVSGGVLHCFSGSPESAEIGLKLGYYISFAGPVTFQNARNLPEVVKMVPADRLLIETDCPYLAPVPHRGERNCSIYVKDTAKKIAEIRGVSVETIAAQTAENAKRLFHIA